MGGKRVAKPETDAAVTTEKKRGKAGWIVLAVAAALVVGAVAGACVYAGSCDRVFPGVTLGGESLAGLTRSELSERVSPDTLLQGTVTITANGLELGRYTQEELGAKVEAAALEEAAWGVGRAGGALGWLQNGWTMVHNRFLGGVSVVPLAVGGYDQEILRSLAAELAADFDREAVDGSYQLGREGLFAVKASDGQQLDQAGLVAALSAMDGAAGEVEAPWAPLPAEALDMEVLARELNADALPARYDTASSKVVDGTVGVKLDAEAAQFVMDNAVPGETVQLPAEILYPEMTAQELEAVLFRDELGTATTSVSGTSARKGNVKLAGECVNGTVLNDGDIFDYNQVVGERTTERGFGAAATYVNGQTVDTVGGGICQVSSTVYLASLLSNLEIVERHNHRFFPGYITKGMDATVSWGGPEFRFKNNTGYPIRIDVKYENSKLTVTIMGTKTDDTYVKMTFKELSTTPYETIYEDTEDLAYGTEKEKQNGYTGRKIETYRNVYDGQGNLLSSTLEAVSNYSKRDRIVLRGTAGKPADTETGGGADTGGGDGGEAIPPEGGDTGDTGDTGGGDEIPDWLA